MSESAKKEVKVLNALGLHARPATMLAKLATSFQAEIKLLHEGELVDARSALAILMMAAGDGTTLEVIADGPDAANAVKAVDQLFASKFGEE